MDIFVILQMFGGIGLFLFGMSLMGSYLRALAGGSLEVFLAKLTTGKSKKSGYLKGWGLGVVVTAIIQSSAATTIMLIGFVNAGIMRLTQAVPVMLGANVGSTMTAQLLRLGDLGSGSVVLRLLKPSSFAAILVGIGAFIFLFAKHKKWKNISGILIGLGILFYGMTTMEQAFEPLRELPSFQRLFTSFTNPFLGVLCGILFTAILQSSSAAVGILQALSATGIVTYATAFPILVGQNIGKCVTILLGSIGTEKKSRRLALSYLLFNVFGSILFLTAVYGIYYTVGISWAGDTVNRGSIANMHLLMNLIPSLIILPFTDRLIKLTGHIIGFEKPDPAELAFQRLDDRLLQTPTVALSQCWDLICEMEKRCRENYQSSVSLLTAFDPKKIPTLEENERFIDKCETVLSGYVIRLDQKKLTHDQRLTVREILNSVSDLERIGDYSISMAYTLRDMQESGTVFTDACKYELGKISEADDYLLGTLSESFLNQDVVLAERIDPLTNVIGNMKDLIRSHHLRRLTNEECSVQAGVDLHDLLNCYDRIASHGKNVAQHVIARGRSGKHFDEMHGHALEKGSDEYISLHKYYEEQYFQPLLFK